MARPQHGYLLWKEDTFEEDYDKEPPSRGRKWFTLYWKDLTIFSLIIVVLAMSSKIWTWQRPGYGESSYSILSPNPSSATDAKFLELESIRILRSGRHLDGGRLIALSTRTRQRL